MIDELDDAINKLNTQLFNVRLRGYRDHEAIDLSRVFNYGSEFKARMSARQEQQNEAH